MHIWYELETEIIAGDMVSAMEKNVIYSPLVGEAISISEVLDNTDDFVVERKIILWRQARVVVNLHSLF